MSSPLLLRSAGRDIDIQCSRPEVTLALTALWEPAMRLRLKGGKTSFPKAVIVLDEQDRLWLDDELICDQGQPDRWHLQIESLMIHRLFGSKSDIVRLHSACVTLPAFHLLFVGPSGAGKSTFTQWAVQRGGALLSDDSLVVKDGDVFGLSRTIQFDAVPTDQPIPPHLDGCDLASYIVPSRDGHPWSVPLWRGSYPIIDSLSIEDKIFVVVELEKTGHDSVRPLSSLKRLSALHAATITTGNAYEGQLGWGPSFAVTWSNPERAFELLMQALEQSSVACAIGSPSRTSASRPPSSSQLER